LTRAKHDCLSAQHIFDWNTSVTGHTQRIVGFPQRKQLPSSTANCRVTMSNTL